MFVSSNGDFDIQKTHINGKGNYVITAGLTDNGILGKTNIPAKIFDSKTITVDMFGCAFYRQFEYKMVTHARVFSLKTLFEVSDNQGIYLACSLGFLRFLFGYENMCSWEKIKNFKVQLPLKEKSLDFSNPCDNIKNIDFDFMESFIRELEEERIRELEEERIRELNAYLLATGLKDYALSAEEEKALEAFKTVQWEEFELPEIFDIKNTHNILSSEIVAESGTTPYLCASAENNGVSSYISYKNELLENGNCIFIGGKTFVVSYQKDDFYSNDSHNLALYLKEQNVTKSNQLYLATCIRKGLSHKYSWGDSISGSKIKSDKFQLPTKNNKPDYATMETFIKAVEKLVIKDVVLYADSKIKATKNVVKKDVEYKINEDAGLLKVAEK